MKSGAHPSSIENGLLCETVIHLKSADVFSDEDVACWYIRDKKPEPFVPKLIISKPTQRADSRIVSDILCTVTYVTTLCARTVILQDELYMRSCPHPVCIVLGLVKWELCKLVGPSQLLQVRQVSAAFLISSQRKDLPTVQRVHSLIQYVQWIAS